MNIDRRDGDGVPTFIFATKGYESRQMHIDRFLSSDHDWLLLLDGDMVFPADALERLRSRGVKFISGYYLRRSYERPLPVWYPYPDDPESFDLQLWVDPPARGRLHKLAASGWGCILLHRDVVLATRALMAPERDVIEDDMDVWPFDAAELLQTVTELDQALTAGDFDAARRRSADIRSLVRPLRLKTDPVGSDLRYPFFARQAGYDLFGDPDVRCGHMIEYPLDAADYDALSDEQRARIAGR